MAKRKLNVAMIGYDFMGRAHSNAWRQVGRFFQDAPFEPVLKVVVGRTEAKVEGGRGRASASRSTRRAGRRWSRARTSTSSTSARPATRTRRSRSPPPRRARRSCARSRSPTPSPTPSACTPPSRRPASSTWSATTTAAARRWRWRSSSSTTGKLGDIHHYRGRLPAGLDRRSRSSRASGGWRRRAPARDRSATSCRTRWICRATSSASRSRSRGC